MAIGTATESRSGSNYLYNFTIESGGSGATWNDVDLRIIDNTGTIVRSGIASYTVYNATFATVCFSEGALETTWSAGPAGSGTTPISSIQTIVVVATIDFTNTGAQLDVYGVGQFEGTTHASIP